MDDIVQPKLFSEKTNQKIRINQLLDKEEAETDKCEHQTSVLGLISATTVDGGRQKRLET